MDRQYFIDQLIASGESHPTRNTKVFEGKKVMSMIFYLKAAMQRCLQVHPQKYYVFISDKGQILECETAENAIAGAFENEAFDYNTVEIGDYVDFGLHGNLYVCGENIGKTKFLVTVNSSERTQRSENSFYLDKDFAKGILEKYGNFSPDD